MSKGGQIMMRLNEHEKRNLIILSVGVFFYFITLLFLKDYPVVHKDSHYLALHTFLELCSIIISTSIAIQSWIVFSYRQSNDRLLYFSGFSIIAVLDLLHLLTYNGMPGAIFIESSVNIATWFWVLARLTQALFIIFILYAKIKTVSLSKRYIYLQNTIIFLFVLMTIMTYFQNELPLLVIEGQGTTVLKKWFEYFISFLLFLSISKLVRLYKSKGKPVTIDFILALSYLLLSELIFTLYLSVYDSLNLLGHLYKIIGFGFFMRVLYISTVKEPFEKLIRARKKLTHNEKRFKTITASLGEGVFVMDHNRRLTFINREGERLLGYEFDEIVGKVIHPLIHGNENGGILPLTECAINKSYENKETVRVDEDIFIHKSGRAFPVSYVATPLIENDKLLGSVIVFQDISEKQEYLRRIEHQAYHNLLTDLPNRHYFVKQLKEEIDTSDLTNEFAVIIIDIDDFKNINDTYSHAVGDDVLKIFGKRLVTLCKDSFVAHISGDEYAIIMHGDKDTIKDQVETIVDELGETITIGHHEIFASNSIGVSLFPYDGVDSDKLIQVADIALYEAKRLGKNQYIFYNDELEYRHIRKNWIEQNLYTAFLNHEITVHYQPIVDSHAKTIIGLEALARWYHPQDGFIPPQEFISVAENNGLIIPIGAHILNTACRDLALLQKKGFKDLYVSINLSLKQIKHPDFHSVIKDVLEKYHIKPRQVQFEITETMTLQEDPDLITSILKLKNSHFRIAIDDFGKGFSSIGYLKDLTVDTLKIDKSYIFNVLNDEKVAQLTRAIITLGQLLDLNIVAEGVESKEHLTFLSNYANVSVQGFYFSRPLPFKEFVEKLLTTQPLET